MQQVLFVVDATEPTGANWQQLLYRACLAIATQVPQPAEAGLLLVRGRHSLGPLLTPTGFTTDLKTQLRRWLRGVLFDGGPGSPALMEALLAAANGDWWREGSTRHVVLVTHSEPRVLPATTPPPRSCCSSTPSCWSPVPEALAASGIALSIVAPRLMPKLALLHAAACQVAGSAVPARSRFDEFPQLLLVSSLMPHISRTDRRAAAAGSEGGASASSATGNGHGPPPPTLPSPLTGNGPTAPWLPPAKRRVVLTAAGSGSGDNQGGVRMLSPQPSPAERWHGGADGEPGMTACLWEGSLTVAVGNLGTSRLMIEPGAACAPHWRALAASWGSSLSVNVYKDSGQLKRQTLLYQELGEACGVLPCVLLVRHKKVRSPFPGRLADGWAAPRGAPASAIAHPNFRVLYPHLTCLKLYLTLDNLDLTWVLSPCRPPSSSKNLRPNRSGHSSSCRPRATVPT